MEMIYFLLGLMLGVGGYLVKTINGLRKTVALVGEDYSTAANHNRALKEKVWALEVDLKTIRASMAQDSYESISDVNKRIDKLSNDFDVIVNRINTRDKDNTMLFKTLENTISKEFTSLKGEINAIKEDPNFLSRY